MSDVTFGTWSIPASPTIIEYSLVVVEEIRHEVAEGFQKLSRGGIEVGGLLYGLREGQTVRIMAIRPAACEHAGGPAFRLSERDRAALRDQLRQNQDDPRLEGMVCVGWYVSHTRSEITLTESDRELFSTYFGQPWQVTLVIRPSRGGNMRAGFFVREPSGQLRADRSYQEFSFPDRMSASFEQRGVSPDRRVPESRGGYRSAEAPSFSPLQDTSRMAQPSAAAAPPKASPPGSLSPTMTAPHSPASKMTSIFGEPATLRPESEGRGKKWIWLVAALIIIAAGVVAGARYISFPATASENMALSLVERDGQLDIEWNRSAEPVAKAVRGTLEIADGPEPRTIPLSHDELSQGKFAYKRATGDIQVRLSVEAPNGTKLQEASRFLGPPPSNGNTDELKALEQRRDELDAEVTRLKQSNDQQAQRIQQLERTLKILQTRPGIN
jgi:proteasome lid subunit RPN8/RPN11